MLEVLMIQKRVKDMAVVFDFMQKNKVHRALNTYLVVYKGLYLKGEIQQAPIAMNVMYLKCLAFGKRRDTQTIMCLLEEMEHLGLRPNMYTFNICIRALGRGGEIDEAFCVLKKVEEEG
ncbi:hypothetical protein G4B88_023548 [Cannabis sativa]|uniref:Pentatricopeptide repeat-containing protein n=1 Tax=Cannabis sativa TaxID=3483 RepID=A0A7J6HUH0_CANSA|nr:hypothetical protein G4B88_023548 [Cannabis sativa]